MHNPDHFKRRILLCATGMSPQIVTETLYALVQQDIPFVPTEIWIITTTEGKRIAELSLLEPGHQFSKLCQDYQLPAIKFNSDNIKVIVNSSNEPLADIRSIDDNEGAGDSICRLVAELTSDANTILHVSIAGGRKTMGVYLGFALSLFGRQQDQLSHVLVSEKYEGNPKFFYPTKKSENVYDRDDKPHDARDAKVTLANIPFVKMQLGIPPALKTATWSFSESVHFVEKALFTRSIEIDIQFGKIMCADQLIEMPPAPKALYIWMAKRRKVGEDFIAYDTDEWKEFLEIYADIAGTGHSEKMKTELAVFDGFKKIFFDSAISNANKALRKVLGRHSAPYEISKEVPGTRALVAGEIPSGLLIDPFSIKFVLKTTDFLKKGKFVN